MNTVAIMHIAKAQLGLTEDEYRDTLERETGKRSAKDMSEVERKKVVAAFRRAGFTPRQKRKSAAKGYVRLLFALWRSCAGKGVIKDGSRQALRAFVEKRAGVSDPEFLTYDQASPLIEALKKMEARGK